MLFNLQSKTTERQGYLEAKNILHRLLSSAAIERAIQKGSFYTTNR